MDREPKAFVYILTNAHKNVLYTGVTSNLARRLHDHKHQAVEGFTKKYNVHCLVYYEVHSHITDAISREKMIKKKSRRGKIMLIESINKNWRDLSEDF